MKEKFTYHENRLRKLSEEFSPDIDSAAIWEEIEGKLPPVNTKRRRTFYWWIAGNLAIVLLIVASMFFFPKETESVPAIIASDTNITVEQDAKQQSAEHIQKQSEQTAENVDILDINNSENQTKVKNTLKSTVTKIKKPTQNNAITINQDRYDEESSGRRLEVIDQDINSKTENVLINASFDKLSETTSSDEVVDRVVLSVPLVKTLVINSLERKLDYGISAIAIEPVKSITWLPSFSFFVGTNLNRDKILSDLSEQRYLSQLDGEVALPGISSTFRFVLENSNSWRVGMGVSYNRIVNRFDRAETVTDVSEIFGTSSSQIDGQGNILNSQGFLQKTTITEYNYRRHRMHDFVDLQFLFGRKLLQKTRFSISTDIVLSGSVIARHQGYYFVDNSALIQGFDSGDDHPYANRLFQAGVSMDLEYSISNISIALRPFLDLALNNLAEETNYYQLKNSRYGVQLGIVYRP